ncbi:MAG: hypothetical protein H8D53_02150 [Bacteroidetes bacterium]|nr:hypothetical protein [Bacteroidota bacterium]
MKNKLKLFIIGSSLFSIAMLIGGCGTESETAEVAAGEDGENQKDSINNPDESIFMIGGQIFSIPSPVQTAFLIKDVGVAFNNDYVNPADNAMNYSSNFSKALNLGVYGADLGYLTIYEQTDGALRYLKSVRGLSKELGLEGAFDEKLADRFSSNIGNQDSMLVFVSDAYRNSDNYLKENDKNDVAALVLAGGWIESIYIAADAAISSNNPLLIERLGDQKKPLASLIAMLGQYNTDTDYEDLINDLEDLHGIFEQIKYTYEYIPSSTDASKKETTIKSKHTVEIADGDLDAIIEKIKSIRTEIVE